MKGSICVALLCILALSGCATSQGEKENGGATMWYVDPQVGAVIGKTDDATWHALWAEIMVYPNGKTVPQMGLLGSIGGSSSDFEGRHDSLWGLQAGIRTGNGEKFLDARVRYLFEDLDRNRKDGKGSSDQHTQLVSVYYDANKRVGEKDRLGITGDIRIQVQRSFQRVGRGSGPSDRGSFQTALYYVRDIGNGWKYRVDLGLFYRDSDNKWGIEIIPLELIYSIPEGEVLKFGFGIKPLDVVTMKAFVTIKFGPFLKRAQNKKLEGRVVPTKESPREGRKE